MKCKYCNELAIKVNITEARSGTGTKTKKVYVCKHHSWMHHGDESNINKIRFQEYGLRNPIGNDPS